MCYNAMFCTKALGPGIQMDATLYTPLTQIQLQLNYQLQWWPQQDTGKLLRYCLKNVTENSGQQLGLQRRSKSNSACVAYLGFLRISLCSDPSKCKHRTSWGVLWCVLRVEASIDQTYATDA